MNMRRVACAFGMVLVTLLAASRLMLADPSSPVTV